MSKISDLLAHLKEHKAATQAELRKAIDSASDAAMYTMLSTLRGRGMVRKREDGRWELGRDPSLGPDEDEDEEETSAKPAAPAPKPVAKPAPPPPMTLPGPGLSVGAGAAPCPPVTIAAIASKPRASDLPAAPNPASLMVAEADRLEARAARLRKLASDYLELQEASP